MTFKRNILVAMEQWKNSTNHKPLVIRGARQVGKTSVINDFGKTFDTFIPLNLEKSSDIIFFKEKNSAKQIFQRICLEKNITPKGKTLLFLDEIQNSPNAVALLRYFYEEIPELYVISAGSLLEVLLDFHKISFPVGRVEFLYLYPMNFREFLLASENLQALELVNTFPFPSWAVESLFRLYKEYAMVGGMPEVVSKYLENKNILDCQNIYRNLFSSYIDDVAKYTDNPSTEQILRTFIEIAPYETGKRITFEKFGNTDYRSKDASEALRMLERAMLIYIRYPTTNVKLPLEQDFKRKPRLHFFDTGLLNFQTKVQSAYFDDIPLDSMYDGMIAEQITFQELIATNNYERDKQLFWVRENPKSNAELDFILNKNSKIIPLEVKSGKEGTLRSLHSFINFSGVKKAIRLYSREITKNELKTTEGNKFTLINLPLFLADQVDKYFFEY